MHLEAGWMGIATARGLTDAARERVKAAVTLDVAGQIDWDGWTPGNPALVETFLGEGKFDYPNFQAFLDRAGVTIRGVEETRLNDLGSILARSAEAGLSMDATASMIQSEFFANGAWAEMVARTEIRRASTESALGYYGEAGIEQKEWLVAWDEACEICQEAADMGPIPLDADFGEAGDGPPGHPNCLCVILPVVPDGETPAVEDLGEGDVDVADEPVIEAEPEAPVVQVPSRMPYELKPTALQPGWDDAMTGYTMDKDQTLADLRAAYETVAQQPVTINTREEGLRGILDDGRFKSCYELPHSKGDEYNDWRREVETDSIGVPTSVPDVERPIYGAIHNTDRLDAYGRIQVVLNDDVKERTSMCVGDSFGGQNPVLLSKVLDGTATPDELARSSEDLLYGYSKGIPFLDNIRVSYWEVQIHGGVSLSDIKEIRLRDADFWRGLPSGNPRRQLIDTIDRLGITVIDPKA